MASDRSRRGQSAEHTGAVRVVKHRLWRPRTILAMTAVAVLAGLAPRAAALTITGGAGYTPPGGGRRRPRGAGTSAHPRRARRGARGETSAPPPPDLRPPGA